MWTIGQTAPSLGRTEQLVADRGATTAFFIVVLFILASAALAWLLFQFQRARADDKARREERKQQVEFERQLALEESESKRALAQAEFQAAQEAARDARLQTQRIVDSLMKSRNGGVDRLDDIEKVVKDGFAAGERRMTAIEEALSSLPCMPESQSCPVEAQA